MTPFKSHRGILVPLDRANVDTDQIIAKQFLKSIARTGFGPQLFYDWRYLADGKSDASFPLNAPRYQGASILVTRNNFGCGSSREHAVWAIEQYGFRVIIAPWVMRNNQRVPAFADIFRNNCGKNGLLTVELNEAEVEKIFQAIQDHSGLEATINLEAQLITLHLNNQIRFPFEMQAATIQRLLNGLDDINLTLQNESSILKFENAKIQKP